MKHIKASLALLATIAAPLALGACSDPAEEAAEQNADSMENQADAMRAGAEATADAMEERADALNGPTEKAVEHQAQATRAMGEASAEALEEGAENARDAN